MSAIALLMTLLVLSYAGTLLSGRTGKGTSSGIEFLALGVVVGPHVFGLVDRAVVLEFSPLVQAALAWLAFVVGLDFARVGGERVALPRVALSVTLSALTGLAIAVGVFFLLRRLDVSFLRPSEILLFAGGAGAVGAETAHTAVVWINGRHEAKGPLSSFLDVLTSSDDFVPIAALGALFAVAPHDHVRLMLPAYVWVGVTALLGIVVGVVTTILLNDAQGYQVWGALCGTILLAVGGTARFGLSPMFATFILGATLAALLPNARALRRLVAPTEQPVVLPLLLLAGARLDLRLLLETKLLLAVLAAALGIRVLVKLLASLAIRALEPVSRPAGARLGLALLSAGPISVAIGLAAALRFPGLLGESLLALSVCSLLLGELTAPWSLKSVLVKLGEIAAPPAAASSPSPVGSEHEEARP